jgi:hypothetical protein
VSRCTLGAADLLQILSIFQSKLDMRGGGVDAFLVAPHQDTEAERM